MKVIGLILGFGLLVSCATTSRDVAVVRPANVRVVKAAPARKVVVVKKTARRPVRRRAVEVRR
ncbi:MAG: hypothetical protein AB8B61_10205 [Cyclobacteriaceae bacterium]